VPEKKDELKTHLAGSDIRVAAAAACCNTQTSFPCPVLYPGVARSMTHHGLTAVAYVQT